MGELLQLFRRRSKNFQELGHDPLLTFYGWPQNCHGIGGFI